MDKCEFCTGQQKELNFGTQYYSGIQATLFPKERLLRIRSDFDEHGLSGKQDVVYINYCPMCGRKL